ncbi:hypothetical protein ACFVWY_20540 [Streptomyces sp. NPDC058195]|uniref:hypothetical protein n=1 Tax=Streptomyces sp. NPDC058195 TaxID=3346375 RepID=UPI0036EFBC6A
MAYLSELSVAVASLSELSVPDFSDDPARDHRLVFRDWDTGMPGQAEGVGRLVRPTHGAGPHTVVDCSCGTGTQAIGLALAGHHVVGSGLSPASAGRAATERAAAEAAAREIRLPAAAGGTRPASLSLRPWQTRGRRRSPH